MRASEKRNVKDKHVVLLALVGETTKRAASMCATLRNAASMAQALHALRDVLRYEQTQRAMLLRLRRQIDSRVVRSAFYQFVQQVRPNVFVGDACIACIHVFAQLLLHVVWSHRHLFVCLIA